MKSYKSIRLYCEYVNGKRTLLSECDPAEVSGVVSVLAKRGNGSFKPVWSKPVAAPAPLPVVKPKLSRGQEWLKGFGQQVEIEGFDSKDIVAAFASVDPTVAGLSLNIAFHSPAFLWQEESGPFLSPIDLTAQNYAGGKEEALYRASLKCRRLATKVGRRVTLIASVDAIVRGIDALPADMPFAEGFRSVMLSPSVMLASSVPGSVTCLQRQGEDGKSLRMALPTLSRVSKPGPTPAQIEARAAKAERSPAQVRAEKWERREEEYSRMATRRANLDGEIDSTVWAVKHTGVCPFAVFAEGSRLRKQVDAFNKAASRLYMPPIDTDAVETRLLEAGS